jgi:hypothetical protein
MKLKIAALLLTVASAFLALGPASAQAAPAPAPAARAVSPASLPTISKVSLNGKADCPAQYFCVWRLRNFGNDSWIGSPMMGYWACQVNQLGWHTQGSWYNHQGGSSRATFYDSHNDIWGVTGGPGSEQPNANFLPIYSLKPCGAS